MKTTQSQLTEAKILLHLWLEWAILHDHLIHVNGIAKKTNQLLHCEIPNDNLDFANETETTRWRH